MKKNNSQFSILNSPFILLLLFLAGCTATSLDTNRQQTANIMLPDSLHESNGNAQLDSLLFLTTTDKQDTNTVLLYIDIGEQYRSTGELKTAAEYHLKAIDLSNELNYLRGIYDASDYYSFILRRMGLNDSAMAVSRKVMELALQHGDHYQVADEKFDLGVGYAYKGFNETAMVYFMEALAYYEKAGDLRSVRDVYIKIHNLYVKMNRYEDAVMYGEKALTICGDTVNDSNYGYSSLHLSLSYSNLNPPQYEKAMEYLQKALQIANLTGNAILEAYAYNYIAHIHFRNNRINESESYYRKAIAFFKEDTFPYEFCLANIGLAKVALYRNDFEQAERRALKNLELIHHYGIRTEELFNTLSFMSVLSTAKHDYIGHNYYKAAADSVRQVVVNEIMLGAIEEMNIKYETEKKEHEIERQQTIIARRNMLLGILAGCIVITVVILALLWFIIHLRNRRNRVLAEMNATKNKFFNIISHDLKNPALAQRDAIRQLVKNAESWNKDEITNCYHNLLKSADEEVELIYTLLSWAQIQTEGISYTPVTFDLPAKLSTDIALIRKIAESKKITLTDNIPSHAAITGDINMLVTVIRNLLTNAVKFTPVGGEVTLTIEPAADAKHTITVSDTGIGMTTEEISNLFCIDKMPSRKGTLGEQGTGLGLIICKELLKKHDSALFIESEEGKGSRFWFEV